MHPPETILHVCAGNQYGGVESMLVCIARESRTSSRVRHAFACCFEGRLSQALTDTGSSPVLLAPVRLSRPWEALRARAALRRVLSRTSPSVVVTHSAWTRIVFGSALRRSGAKTVAWIHGASVPTSRLDRWGQRPRPDLVIVNSRHTRGLTEGLFRAVPRKMLHCPVPVPPKVAGTDRQRLRESLGVHDQRAVVLIAARMEAWKGHALLLDGLAKIPASREWACWIVGGPQTSEQTRYLRDLEARADRQGLTSRLNFLGERTDVHALMAAADIYCQPNLGPEPFGIVFVEALYAGCPVVTSALGGALEILDDSCGRMVPAADADALARTLDQLVAEPALRSRLGSAGPTRALALCEPSAQVGLLDRHLLELAGRQD